MSLPKKLIHRTRYIAHRTKNTELSVNNFIYTTFTTITILSLLFTIYSLRFTPTASAQIPPGNNECNEVAYPEFHSLRPYQASNDPSGNTKNMCYAGLSDIALFCGNDVIVSDSITVRKNQAQNCVDNGDGTETCTFVENRSRSLAVDLSGAEFPIMGYTEGNVVNSQIQPDPEPFDDTTKVNEYVSWYLNGINERTEYRYLDVDKDCLGETTQKPGFCKPTIPLVGTCLESFILPVPNPLLQSDGKSICGGLTEQCCVNPLVDPVEMLDRDKLVNYSGPIKKLLPVSIQHRIRIDEVDDAYASHFEEPLRADLQYPTNDRNARHDQVAACTFGIPFSLGPIDFGQIGGIPAPCYDNSLLGKLVDFLSLKRENRLAEWHPEEEDKLPPLEEDYSTFRQYLAAYKRWRGESCLVVEIPPELPIIGKIPIIGGAGFIYCYNNPLNPDYWAELWPYIPFSSTEDRKGEVEVQTATIQPQSPDMEVSNISIVTDPADLFVPHMQESVELADILQRTFVARGENRNSPVVSGVSPPAWCDLTNVRSNPGDNLFAGEINVDLSYTATFTCNFPIYDPGAPISTPLGYDCNDDLILGPDALCFPKDWGHCIANRGVGPPHCPNQWRCGIECFPPPDPNPECTKTALVSLALQNKIPLVDEAWSRLVAGDTGVFKRIFPKIGESSPILGLLDIPGATNVTYSDGVVYAGNPGNQRSGESAELYFPHIGGIYEYFLHGIQTALRPKGFGYQLLSGQPNTIPPNADINCDQTAPEVNLPNTINKQQTYQLALNWVSGMFGNHVLECYNDVVRRSLAAGINPAFSIWLWLHESNASNYNISVQDFGAAYPAPVGFVDQINEYFARARRYTAASSLCTGKNVTDLQAFAYIYRSGVCDPSGSNGGAQEFYNAILSQWDWISPRCPIPTHPTDTSCY